VPTQAGYFPASQSPCIQFQRGSQTRQNQSARAHTTNAESFRLEPGGLSALCSVQHLCFTVMVSRQQQWEARSQQQFSESAVAEIHAFGKFRATSEQSTFNVEETLPSSGSISMGLPPHGREVGGFASARGPQQRAMRAKALRSHEATRNVLRQYMQHDARMRRPQSCLPPPISVQALRHGPYRARGLGP